MMIPRGFDYVRVGSVEEAVNELERVGEGGKLIGGGQSLIPLMKFRLVSPRCLIDIGRIESLCHIEEADGYIEVGGGVTYKELVRNDLVKRELPLLAFAGSTIGDSQVRSRGTLGGSLVHSDPAGDLPAVVLALDGTVVLQGLNGTREIRARDFFQGFLEVDIHANEILRCVRFPKQREVSWSFRKILRRRQDWALAGMVVVRGSEMRMAGLNLSEFPRRLDEVERVVGLGGTKDEVVAAFLDSVVPGDDVYASASYKRTVGKVILEKVLEDVGFT